MWVPSQAIAVGDRGRDDNVPDHDSFVDVADFPDLDVKTVKLPFVQPSSAGADEDRKVRRADFLDFG